MKKKTAPASSLSPRVLDLLAWVVLILLCLMVYGRCLAFEHTLYDDPNIIFENPNVMGGLTWENIRWALFHPNFGLYMPLPTITFMLDRNLFGDWEGGFHGMTLLWHILCVCTFYLVIKRLTQRPAAVFAAALLAAVHPVQAMTVNWISARNEIMPAFFMLLSIEMYRCYALRTPVLPASTGRHVPGPPINVATPRRTGASLAFMGGSLFFMFLGIMSKQGIVLLPVVLLLLDYWPLGRIELSFAAILKTLRRAMVLVLEKTPWFALSAFAVLFAVYGKRQFGMIQESTLLSPLGNIGFALTAYMRYLFHMICPEWYIMAYSVSGSGPAWWMIGGSALVLFGATALALSQLWKRPWVIVFWGWFVLFLLPVSGLVRYAVESIALRYLYTPGMGLYLLAGFGLYGLARRKKSVEPEPEMPAWYWTLLALLVLAYGALAFRQSGFWKNSETLAQRALAVTNGSNALAHNHISVLRARQGLYTQAFAHAQKAVELEPHRNVWKVNYATSLNARQRYEETMELIGPIVNGDMDSSAYPSDTPDNPNSFLYQSLYGSALVGLSRFEEGLPYLERAIQINPSYTPSLFNYGLALLHLGRKEEARPYFERVLALKPDHAGAKALLKQLDENT